MSASSVSAFISGCLGTTLTPAEIDFFGRTRPWGLIVFRRNCQSPEQLRDLTAAFRDCVGRADAPVFVDQEGGRVQRLAPPAPHWRAYPAARQYLDLHSVDPLAAVRAARSIGRLMAHDLAEAGISANCIPVLDVPQAGAHEVIGARAWGTRPEEIVLLARAQCAGFARGGILPVMKHVPGHGRANADSHLALPVVTAAREVLEAVDFMPFAAMADLPMAMTAHVIYTALDADNPATTSRTVIDLIRKTIGFDGLLMTDDVSMKALSGSFTQRTRAALDAGCDMVLHCNGDMAEMEEVAAAAGSLEGKGLARAHDALAQAPKPVAFDAHEAMADLERIMRVS